MIDAVYVLPLPTTLPELVGKIPAAVSRVAHAILKNVWTELEYGVDVCRASLQCHHWTSKLLHIDHKNLIT
jgi:hypothetical protein